jgi:hypothetical protein
LDSEVIVMSDWEKGVGWSSSGGQMRGGAGSVRAVTHGGGGITAALSNGLTPPPVSRVEISVQEIWKLRDNERIGSAVVSNRWAVNGAER